MISNPLKKEKFLDRLAEDNGVAIVVVNEDSEEVSVSNNNSMCRSLYASAEFAPYCARFCGRAFAAAEEAGKTVEYECYAGLTCKAVPVWDGGKPFVAIVGRTFLKAENYRRATETAITGEWRQFRPTEFFENVLISGSDQSLERVASRLEKFSSRERNDILEVDGLKLETPKPIDPAQTEEAKTARPDPGEITNLINKFKTETEKADGEALQAAAVDRDMYPKASGEWRSLFGSLMNLEYRDACKSILSYLKERYSLGSLVWLERREDRLEVLVGLGRLADKSVKIGIAADNQRLEDAARREMPLEFHERKKEGGINTERTLSLFPVTIGDDIRGAIGIDSRIENQEQKHLISRFAQTLSSQLEILRLRDEVSRRDWLSRAVIRFNENLRKIDADDFWQKITQISAELVNA
ncbi:MAG: PocR ligand-binding domain-containing protein, partial [Pyrinomonadaceae bacterium]